MKEKITVTAQIKNAKYKVWDLYTDAKHIVNWNFASEDWHCPSASNDLKVGGKSTARMEAKDGSFGFDFETTYTEIVPQQKLAYVMQDGRNATVTFDAVSDETIVTIVFDPENENSPELQQQGWQAILNNFKKYAELKG